MARPNKQGIDYFPLDCQFDDQVEMYLLEKEAIGLAVLIVTWQIIYSNEGYYTTNGRDLFLLIKKRVNASIKEIKDCISACLDRNIFNKTLFNKYGILTSKGVQERFFEAAKRKKSVRYNPDYIVKEVKVSSNAVKIEGDLPEAEDDNILKEFKRFWELYDKKVSKDKTFKLWQKLSKKNKAKIFKTLPAYLESKPDKQFRKNPDVYLRNKSWEDEIVFRPDPFNNQSIPKKSIRAN